MEKPKPKNSNSILIVGCGDIGVRVAKLEQKVKLSQNIEAFTHTPSKQNILKEQGITPILGNLDEPETFRSLDCREKIIYYFAPPNNSGITDLRLQHFLEILKASNIPKRFVLISTTGVYGDCQGKWVTEENPLNPQSDRAKRRVAAEELLQKWQGSFSSVSIVILRVPGIYGPGRLPLRFLKEQKPLILENEAPFSNRIHADDLAQICVTSAYHSNPQQIYNVSDGNPTTMTDYFLQVADLLNMPHPSQISFEEAKKSFSPMMLSFLSESKRISNERLLNDFKIKLQYPNLKLGLPACL